MAKPFLNTLDTESTMNEEETYERIFTMLLMSGEYREQDIDTQVHEIMDNPHIYPVHFMPYVPHPVDYRGRMYPS